MNCGIHTSAIFKEEEIAVLQSPLKMQTSLPLGYI